MKKLILVAMMGLSSTAAFAGFQIYEGASEGRGNEKKFDCHFRAVGKKGVRCEAHVRIERQEGGGSGVATDPVRREASLHIDCTNGFELRDRDAKKEYDDGILLIKGRDNGDRAKLAIKLRDEALSSVAREHGDDYRAWLTIERDGRELELRGRCEKDGGDPQLM